MGIIVTMDLSLFDYSLPDHLIAHSPLEARDHSQLMSVNIASGQTTHRTVQDLPSILSSSDILVLNETKVIPARLFGHRSSGGRVELLLLNAVNESQWAVMIKPAKRIKLNEKIQISDNFQVLIDQREGDHFIVSFNCSTDLDTELLTHGKMPIPPYLDPSQHTDDDLRTSYQTVYAKTPGAVAAPTAGLHFTPELLEQIQANGTRIVKITLHVGLGTFNPIRHSDITQHQMHPEWFHVSEEAANILNERSGNSRVIAVGTTSFRALESCYKNGEYHAKSGLTSIFIYPGIDCPSIDGLITNFHLPKSSLLLLVSAFAGTDTIKQCYQDAIQNNYRFYSFGDAMFLFK